MDALTEYRNFISNKKPVFGNHGFAVNPAQVNELLKPFQRDIVVWAVRKGRAAVHLHLTALVDALPALRAEFRHDPAGSAAVAKLQAAVVPAVQYVGAKMTAEG